MITVFISIIAEGSSSPKPARTRELPDDVIITAIEPSSGKHSQDVAGSKRVTSTSVCVYIQSFSGWFHEEDRVKLKAEVYTAIISNVNCGIMVAMEGGMHVCGM